MLRIFQHINLNIKPVFCPEELRPERYSHSITRLRAVCLHRSSMSLNVIVREGAQVL